METQSQLWKTKSARPLVDPRSILVVDDDVEFLELILRQFARGVDYQIQSARSFDESLEILREEEFSLVVSDWALDRDTAPDMFTQVDDQLGKCARSTPILFMSGSDKVSATHQLSHLKNFEPVSFVLKRLGPSVICHVAETIVRRGVFPLQKN